MKQTDSSANGWQASNIHNMRRVMLWTGAWVISMAVATFGPKFLWEFNTVLTIMAVLANLALGSVMILANIRQVKGMDEMQQKIFLDASAVTLGVGLIAGCSYELLEDIRLIGFQPEISHLILLMCLTFAVSMIVGNRRFQ